MFKRGLMAAVAAVSLVSAPALAQSSASKLSVAQARAGASVEGEKLAGGALIGVLVFVAAVAVIYFVAEESDESESA